MRAKRRITRGGVALLALVLLGAATSVVPALGAARYLPPRGRAPMLVVFDPEGLGCGVLEGEAWVRTCTYWPEAFDASLPPTGGRGGSGHGPPGAPAAAKPLERPTNEAPAWCRLAGIYKTLGHPQGSTPEIVSVVEAGWPLKCLRGAAISRTSSISSPVRQRTWIASWEGNPWSTYGVPTGPIWTGIAFNTALYASLWWVLLLAPRQLRRALRRRRGACPRCGYDRAGLAPSAPCPECGQPSPAQEGPGPLSSVNF